MPVLPSMKSPARRRTPRTRPMATAGRMLNPSPPPPAHTPSRSLPYSSLAPPFSQALNDRLGLPEQNFTSAYARAYGADGPSRTPDRRRAVRRYLPRGAETGESASELAGGPANRAGGLRARLDLRPVCAAVGGADLACLPHRAGPGAALLRRRPRPGSGASP